MQIGMDLGPTDTSATTARGLIRIAAMGSTNYVVSGLPYRVSTTLESFDYTQANLILSQMRFDIPAGQYLGIGAQSSGDAEARGFVIYGVD
jgi:ABC-type transport system involved in Fe-S cluster assembly fused permease/ATPase subunit